MFGRKSHEAPAEANVEEAPKPAESGSRRERPDFKALAQQRVEAVKTKTGSRWSEIKKGFAKARDFVLTLDSRTAYRAGQAKDVGVAGAEAVGRTAVRGAEATVEGVKYVGGKAVDAGKAVGRTASAGAEIVGAGTAHMVEKTREKGEAAIEAAVAGVDYVGGKAVDAGKAVGRGAKATAEFGVGMAVAGVEAVDKGANYVFEKGQQGAEMAMEGINKGIESAHKKYTEVRTGITEKFRSMREALQNRADMRAYAAEQKKLDETRAKIASLEVKAGLKQANMAAIEQRLAARGITREESEPSELSAAA